MASGESSELNPANIPQPALVPTEVCPNCQAPQYGEWCYNCGQRKRSAHREFLTLLSDAFDDTFSPDSRTAHTLIAILFRPGYLTREYFAGRRARYIPPLKLYLVSSVIFFFLLSLEGLTSDAPITLVDRDNNLYVTRDDVTQGNITQGKATQGNAAQGKDAPPPSKDSAGAPDQAQAEDWRKSLPKQVDHINLDFLSPEANLVLQNRLKAQVNKAIRMAQDDPQGLIGTLLDVAPPVMFMLVPLFAMLIMFFYLGSGRYYAEHLVLAAHNQSFMFIILIVNTLAGAIAWWLPPVGKWTSVILWTWTPVYLFLSLKKTYGQGYTVTLLKFMLLSLGYWILFLMGFLIALLLGLMAL